MTSKDLETGYLNLLLKRNIESHHIKQELIRAQDDLFKLDEKIKKNAEKKGR